MSKQKSVKKANKKLGKHLVRYVDNSSPMIKFFNTEKQVHDFVDKFQKENPKPEDGYWIDFYVLNVGTFVPLDLSLEYELA